MCIANIHIYLYIQYVNILLHESCIIYLSAYDPIYFLKMSNSPPVRRGLLDFMLAYSASSSSSSSSSLVVVLSALCRTSTATICARCSLPDLSRDHLSPVFPPRPQPKPSEPNVPCRTSTATICGQCSLPGLNRQKECQKICQKECQKICQKDCQKICQKECQTECQIECQTLCQKECQKEC